MHATSRPLFFCSQTTWLMRFLYSYGYSLTQLAPSSLSLVQTTWLPAIGKNRITAMTQSRSDWCISRQRSWGVPIPVFYDRQTDEPLINAETLAHAQVRAECIYLSIFLAMRMKRLSINRSIYVSIYIPTETLPHAQVMLSIYACTEHLSIYLSFF